MLRFYSPAVESSEEIKAGASCALIYALKVCSGWRMDCPGAEWKSGNH